MDRVLRDGFEFYRDLPARPKRPERLFFGLLPDAETASRAARVRERFIREHRLEGTRLRSECLHVSLHHVGDYRRLRTKFIHAATLAASAVAMQRCEMTFQFIGSFDGVPLADGRPRKRPLVLLGESAAVRELHKLLGAAMEKIGLRATAHFMPHMTLFYGQRPIPVQAITPIRFAVDEFALIHSALGLARYDVMGRWPLNGRATAGSTEG